MGPEAEKQLELVRFDFTGDLLSKMEEHEQAALTFQNASGETGLTHTPGDSGVASHVVM